MNKKLLVVALLLITACAAQTTGPNQFFTGKDGVVTTVEYIPSKLYYYQDVGPEGNQFELGIKVQNKGSSFTRGAIFISGYDPELLHFRDINIEGAGAPCGISIVSIGLGDFGGIFSCGDSFIASGGGQTYANIESIGSLFQGFGATWWDSDAFDFGVSYSDAYGDESFHVNFNTVDADLEYFGNGRLFIALFSGINFKALYGQEYFLAGNLPEFPGGEVTYFDYPGYIKTWPPGLAETRQRLMITSCYMYTTYAAPMVCIDPDPQSGGRKACAPHSIGFKSQGAPVAITSVEQENTPRKIIFRMTIQNVGGGIVYDPGQLMKCSPYYNARVKESDLNVVWLGDARIGLQRLEDCTPRNFVRLQNGKGTITCTYPITKANIAARSAYQTPLVLELWYGYSQVIQRDIQMKRVQ